MDSNKTGGVRNQMSFRRVIIIFVVFLIQACSFQNEFGKTRVRFSGLSTDSSTKNFQVASQYDYACLTYEGGDGIQRSQWQKIEKTSTLLSVDFEIPSLLGGYVYRFTLFGINSSLTGEGPLSGNCPRILPKETGWARLGFRELKVGTNLTSIDVNIPLDLKEGGEESSPTLPGAPGKPGGFPGDGKVTLNWTAPTNTGGSGITDYVIRYSSNSGGAWTTFNDGLSADNANVEVTGLVNGTTYIFQVAAVSAIGQGVFSEESDAITPASSSPTTDCVGLLVCGGPGNSCYKTENLNPAGGKACLSVGSNNIPIELVTLSSGVKVWKNLSGNEILKATGFFFGPGDWQKKLNPSGEGYLSENFTALSEIEGRVCPANIFVERNVNADAVPGCLYYTSVKSAVSLSENGFPDPLSVNSGNQADASWFEGNINQCSGLGMRLPTLFEVFNYSSVSSLSLPTLPTDFAPTPVSEQNLPNLVPAGNPGEFLWTATAVVSLNSSSLFTVEKDTAENPQITVSSATYSGESRKFRCVLPAAVPPT